MKKFFTLKNITFSVLIILFLLATPKIINILLLFFAAYVFACALNQYVEKLSGKISRKFAIPIVLLSVFLIVNALFIPIFIVGIKEISAFISALPARLTNIGNYITTASLFGHKISDLIDIENLDLSSILGASPDVAQSIIDHSMSFTAGIVQFFVIAIALTMIVFYILADKDYLKSKFIALIPPDLKGKAVTILTSISEKVGGYVRGQLLSMAYVGVCTTVVLAIFSAPYSILLGLITGILDIIPIIGPSIALGCILLAIMHIGLWKIITIAILFLLIQQSSNSIVKPLIFGRFMALHPLTIFLALFLADQFIGFWGIILSPAIAATVCVLIDELYVIPMNHTSGKSGA